MASQVEAAYCFENVLRGHHIYKIILIPSLGEILMVFPEPLNDHDRHAVCVKKDNVIVGHVYTPRAGEDDGHFLMHGGQVSCEVTGRRKLGNGSKNVRDRLSGRMRSPPASSPACSSASSAFPRRPASHRW